MTQFIPQQGNMYTCYHVANGIYDGWSRINTQIVYRICSKLKQWHKRVHGRKARIVWCRVEYNEDKPTLFEMEQVQEAWKWCALWVRRHQRAASSRVSIHQIWIDEKSIVWMNWWVYCHCIQSALCKFFFHPRLACNQHFMFSQLPKHSKKLFLSGAGKGYGNSEYSFQRKYSCNLYKSIAKKDHLIQWKMGNSFNNETIMITSPRKDLFRQSTFKDIAEASHL